MYKHYLYICPVMNKTESKFCNCLYHSATAFARTMTRIAEESFAKTGLSPSHGFLVMTVNDNPGIQPKDISCQMQLTPSTVTRLIEKLEYKGLVERRSLGRATEVFPTESGKAVAKDLSLAWKGLYKKYTEKLGVEHSRDLTTRVYQANQTLEE